MSRRICGLIVMTGTIASLGLVTVHSESVAQDCGGYSSGCAASSYGCSASAYSGGYAAMPMQYSMPAYGAPVYNSAGMCLNCGRVHGSAAANIVYAAPVHRPGILPSLGRSVFGPGVAYAPPRVRYVERVTPVARVKAKVIVAERPRDKRLWARVKSSWSAERIAAR